MTGRFRRTAVSVVALGLALGQAMPAYATIGDPDAVIDGTGDGVKNETGAGQTKTYRIKPGKKVTAYVVLQNDMGVADANLSAGGDGSRRPFIVRYRLGDTDVTAQVLASLALTLNGGWSTTLEMTIKARRNADEGKKRRFEVTLWSFYGAPVRDVVAAKAVVK